MVGFGSTSPLSPGQKKRSHRCSEKDFDVVIIDLDSDAEYALELIEKICVDSLTQVISFSSDTDQDLLLRCMRAGAREFLPMPLTSDAMAGALTRVSARRIEMPARTAAKPSITQSARGKMLIFLSAKGGAGVTTLSCALALSLAQEFQKRTLLIDLNFPLGDAALTLGSRANTPPSTPLRIPEGSMLLSSPLCSCSMIPGSSSLPRPVNLAHKN